MSVRVSSLRAAASAPPPLLLLLAATPAPRSAPETAVKAAFLVKFGAYVDWPAPASDQPMVLCVVGRDTLGRMIDEAVVGQEIGGQPIILRHLGRVDPSSGCRIAYIAGSPAQPVEASLAALASAPVLTATDSEAGPAHGIIHFEIAQNRIRFRIDQQQAARAGLTISSKLLALALSVQTKDS